ncbi:2-C-methyl-D-erythritol 2,4-cyclodiphosphate synthase [Peptoniphilus raoultii]|uniref:2-C-methyl-D-erythritol 2,4-cyclodiphosphate synthase n=1 Tax=Peptoniphilus raoultii TaxID=1776387 RepID=UPI0008DAD9AE|nr:2-C-methyl-D-erythritol 2,4-cyclodiphosphate synthase [Peptoniphilus raoultii]
MRIGIGYDVHKFASDRKLFIGGLEIPYEYGLLGHSDADVLIHAIMDALLGAMGKRDIGFYFPDNDEEFKDIDSKILLKKVFQMMKNENYKVSNIDSIVICEKPKLKNYIEEMRKILAKILETSPSNISIKATTTEKLGFTGREEGIAAQAVCLIERE